MKPLVRLLVWKKNLKIARRSHFLPTHHQRNNNKLESVDYATKELIELREKIIIAMLLNRNGVLTTSLVAFSYTIQELLIMMIAKNILIYSDAFYVEASFADHFLAKSAKQTFAKFALDKLSSIKKVGLHSVQSAILQMHNSCRSLRIF
jgi:hypothetical protein